MTFYKNIIALSVLATLTACGGGSSSTGSSSSDVKTNTGTFVDSPVINIGYKTETLEGVTNAKGEYDYVEGESVTFFIGDLVLPATKAQGVVTPLDLAGTTDVQDVKVINMLRLLQTLDQDGDPSNGLTITEDAKSVATEINLSLPIDEFAALPAVIELIKNADLDTPITELISINQALAHFEKELIDAGIVNKTLVGTWVIKDAVEVELLTFSFFKDGTYLHNEVTNDDEWFSGMEWGNYEYDKETNKLTIGDVLFDGNKGAGLVGKDNDLDSDKLSAAVDGDTLDLDITFLDGGSETLTFSRVVSQGIEGTWVNPNTENHLLSFSFFNDGTYLHSEVDFDSGDDEVSGMEWGTYQRDTETGELTITTVYDDNGETGVSHASGDFFANVVDGMLVFSFDGEDEDISFYNQHMTIPAPQFTEAYFIGKVFTFQDEDNKEVILTVSDGGLGTISFAEDDTNDITWNVNANGELKFHEADAHGDYWDWTFTAKKIKPDTATLSVVFIGMENGNSGIESFSTTLKIAVKPVDPV